MAATTVQTTGYPLTWDLESLFPRPESPQFRGLMDDLESRLRAVAEEADQIGPFTGAAAHVAAWERFLQAFAAVEARFVDLRAHVHCCAAEAAENKLYQQYEAALAALEPLRDRISSSIDFGMKGASDQEFQAAIEASSELRQIEYYLALRRRFATLRLPREQESLSADLAVDGLHAWGRLYDRLSGALRVTVIERGKTVQKSPGQVLFDSPQRTVRENNFYAADAAWSSVQDTCADALNHIAGSRLTVYRRLGLKDHLEAPLCHNRMCRETLDTMWQAITDRKEILGRFLKRKAELLGIEKLAWYDLAAPLPGIPGGTSQDQVSYDQACEWIRASFGEFSPELGDFATQALRERWIEAENRSGKRQGGFCTGFYAAKQSRIFMTYTDSADSMSTLAHELGHAYHTYVLRDQPIYLSDYPMNLAETASTFAEAVLAEQRYRRAKTDFEKLTLLEGLLSDAVAFLMNIHARFLFEDQFHRERGQGEVSAERLSELMEQAQRTAYLGALAEDGWNPRFWVSKLHFYITELPFYNFPYTFGYLLSMGIYALGREAGAGFAENYRRLLMATGCQNAEDAVQSTLGYDLRQPTFWLKSLDIITDRVNQFLELSDRLKANVARL